jgi:thioredoxin reductase (NADPH)
LTNRGVSYCAICDGFLFRGREVAVVGGGYSALETALYLSNIASKVYLIHRRTDFRAEKEIVEKVKDNPKIILFLEFVLIEVKGQNKVEKLVMRSLLNGEEKELIIVAVFPCIGLSPLSNLVHELGVCDHHNYVKINEDCSTSVAGLLAAGDVTQGEKKKVKQIVTAVAEGAIAAQLAIKYLKDNE